MYSTTKYIGGHGTDRRHGDRRREFRLAGPLRALPDPERAGSELSRRYLGEAAKPLGPIAYILRMRVVLLRDLGASMSPFNAFLFLQGLETPLRMRAHCENATKVAAFLGGHHQKSRKSSSRPCRPARCEGERIPISPAGMARCWGFELKDGREAGRRFIDSLELVYHVANIGDARTLAIHPATTTHSQLSLEDRLATGVSEGYVRLSIGIEHIDDILEDLSQALDAA